MVTFRYELEGVGWADAYLSDGESSAQIPASYLCDALRDLVDAVQSLFTADTATCFWQEEPGEVKWHFCRNGDSMHVDVKWFNEARVHPERNEGQLILDRVLFTGDSPFVDFATQVERELQRTIEK